ncbi:MAG TPA: nitrate reductase subunit alpha, partial [Actinomycetota bacterium]|nr:nitrate reductase subunit alpha [Actinomycetota bacterium]
MTTRSDATDEFLVKAGRFFTPGDVSSDLRTVTRHGGRQGDVFYRDRWSHDKVVRSTHGVNCTGSCSWKVYVKDGIITWETQQTDYPSVGPDSPEYEPRGCPRGAAFSWYTYSPTRIRYPYVRSTLLEAYRAAKLDHPDPVDAWAAVVGNERTRQAYQSARGKGGLVRTSWAEVNEIIAAAHVHTAKEHGPDRIFGFSPIPAMSMASHAAGSRFISLMGGAMLSFYDWYCDLPVASPQVFGDQTDVPESADWWNASYLIMWGANVPVTRTPDAHFMAEARYRGQKVVTVSPDYADNTKFADEWLTAHPGTDAALGMAMGHVILKEFYVDRQVPRFVDYVKQYSDMPFLVTLREKDGAYVPDKFLTAADLGDDGEGAAFKTVLIDGNTGRAVVPNGSLGFRYGEAGKGKWNLDLEGMDPALSLLGAGGSHNVEVHLPRFDVGHEDSEGGGVHTRGIPVVPVGTASGERLVTTVFDLLLAQYGVGRDGLPGQWPAGYDDPEPYTPAWQEEITGVPAEVAARIGREFAQNAEDSGGRSMIILGAGTNHWFHSDVIYRTFLAMITMTGCQGINGGGWAHYVGQEKARPITGWANLAFALDWQRPARQMIGTAFWYVQTSQWRYDNLGADLLATPLGDGMFENTTMIDTLAQSARSGWMPSFPSLNRNPIEIVKQAREQGLEPAAYVKQQLLSGDLKFAVEDPDAPENWPRVLTVWRANLLGSSSKGNEYFLKHLLGTSNAVRAEETDARSDVVTWRDEAPSGKLDLLVSIDFRMTSTGLFGDILLPAATWYEKHDISSTDMHPYVHAFTPAIDPPWETKSDYDIFGDLARKVSELSHGHLEKFEDLMTIPLFHDSPDEMAVPGGVVKDWRTGEVDLIPGVTAPKFVLCERDYTAVGAKMSALGPLLDTVGTVSKGVAVKTAPEMELLRHLNGVIPEGPAAGQPAIVTAAQACEAILTLSGTTNGRVAVEGFRFVEERTGQQLADLALDNEGKRISFADTQARPVPVITSPEWSGSEHGGRRYTAFTINVERLKPWHTLTGRMHFFLDHDWMTEIGEQMPTFRPPLNMHRLYGDQGTGAGQEVTVRYLTPHSKWSIHSEYQDNLFMLSLSRGGPEIWMSPQDADAIGV